MKTWSSIITYSVFDTGREYKTEEEYKECVKETFRLYHDIELEDEEITEIEFEEVTTDE
jgi:hypothetical protein